MMRPVRTAFGFLLVTAAALAQSQGYVISTVAGGVALPATPAAATSVPIASPQAVATDAAGNVYFASLYSIFKMDPSGVLTHIAGTGHQGDSGDGGPAVNAALTGPAALAADKAGNVYVADGFSGRVRKIAANGTITTVAGNGVGCCYNNGVGDGGPATSVQLFYPYQVAVDAASNVYIGEWNTTRIRKVTADGIINTVVGTGQAGYSGDGGPATAAQIGAPWGMTFDNSGNLYFSDAIPGDDIEPTETHIRKVTPGGIISTVAGNGMNGYAGDGGPAADAQFDEPGQLTVDGSGNIFVPDGARIRKISAAGIVTTIAGDGTNGYSGDGGTAAQAKVSPSIYGQGLGLAADGAGNLYIADSANKRVRKISTDGNINTVAGNGGDFTFLGDGNPATAAALNAPVGVVTDSSGNLYIADTLNHRIRKVSGGVISTIAGDGTANYSGDGGAAAQARVSFPAGMTLDSAGNLYFADAGNNRVRKISPDGVITTVAGDGESAQLDWPKDVALDGAGNLYIADSVNNRVRMVSPTGAVTTVAGTGVYGSVGDGGPATSAQLNTPTGVALDAAGNLYIADTFNYRVRKVSASGVITTVAGNGMRGYSGDGGAATAAQLEYPEGVKVDGAGNVYIGDGTSVRMVSPAGIITTVAGNGMLGSSGDGGPATQAQVGAWGLAFDNAGNLYVADTWNSVVRVLRPQR